MYEALLDKLTDQNKRYKDWIKNRKRKDKRKKEKEEQRNENAQRYLYEQTSSFNPHLVSDYTEMPSTAKHNQRDIKISGKNSQRSSIHSVG
jgi:hypothetical protein